MQKTTISSCEESGRWTRWTLVLIGALFLFRLGYAASVPLDLVHDEAYYWDWSRQLDWCYYSKPPAVAWLIALATSLFGATTFVVRLPAVILGSVGLVLIYFLAVRLYNPRTGFWAVVLCGLTPASAATSLLMTIDAPLLFCWTAALLAFWCFLQRGRQQAGWLLAAIAAVGLGLLSKQTMLAFLILSGVFLAWSRDDRTLLGSGRYWLFLAGLACFLAPLLWWNSQHGWITFQHTGGHFNSESFSWPKRLAEFGEFFLVQFAVLSPATFALMLAVFARVVARRRQLERREKFLVVYSLLPLVLVHFLALRQRVEPNWPAPFYLAGIILLAGWLSNPSLAGWKPTKARAYLRRAWVGGLAATIAACVLPWGLGLEGSKLDVAVRLRGWQRLGRVVGQQFSALPNPDNTFVWVTNGRAVASELAFYMPQRPEVFLWNGAGDVGSQYDLWGGPKKEHRNRDALIVTGLHDVPHSLLARFEEVRPLGQVRVPIGNRRRLQCRLWHGTSRQPFGERMARQPSEPRGSERKGARYPKR